MYLYRTYSVLTENWNSIFSLSKWTEMYNANNSLEEFLGATFTLKRDHVAVTSHTQPQLWKTCLRLCIKLFCESVSVVYFDLVLVIQPALHDYSFHTVQVWFVFARCLSWSSQPLLWDSSFSSLIYRGTAYRAGQLRALIVEVAQMWRINAPCDETWCK